MAKSKRKPASKAREVEYPTLTPKQRAFVAAYGRCGGFVASACRLARVNRSTFYKWLKSPAGGELKAAIADAEEDALDALKAEAWRRAMKTSDRLLMFMIKQRDPSFRDAHRIEHSGSVVTQNNTLVIAAQQMSDDELRTLTNFRKLIGVQSGNSAN